MANEHSGKTPTGNLSTASGQDITEDEYYGHIVNSLDYGDDEMPGTPLIDFVASAAEWERCKAALLRWIAEHDKDDYSGRD